MVVNNRMATAEELIDQAEYEPPSAEDLVGGNRVKSIRKVRAKSSKKLKFSAPKLKFSKSKKVVKAREKSISNVLKAFGVIKGKASGAGAGRPRGTGKYQRMGYSGVFGYKKAMAQKKALYEEFKREQLRMLMQKRGLSEEQVQQLQFARSVEEPPQPQVVSGGGDPRRMQAQNVRELADEEMQFRKWSARSTVSPNTQTLLTRLRRVQNMGKISNIEQQRRHFERRLLSEQGNLMKAHLNMTDVNMDFTKLPEGDLSILNAPNVFRENPENNILRTRARNILNTGENTLKFF